MDDQKSPAFYKQIISQAKSYHDLAMFRSRYYSLLESVLSKEDCLAVKDYWSMRAKDENLPIAP